MELTSKYELVSLSLTMNKTHWFHFPFSGTFLPVRLVHWYRHHYFHYRNLSNEIEIKIYRFSIFADMTWNSIRVLATDNVRCIFSVPVCECHAVMQPWRRCDKHHDWILIKNSPSKINVWVWYWPTGNRSPLEAHVKIRIHEGLGKQYSVHPSSIIPLLYVKKCGCGAHQD